MRETMKEDVIELLKTTPSIYVTCRKLGLGRATYYRWLESDPAFAQACQESIKEGLFEMHGIAEQSVLDKVRDGEWQATTYWLRKRHPDFMPITRAELINDSNNA